MAKQIDTQTAAFVVVYDMNDAYDFVVAFEDAAEAEYYVDLVAASYRGTHIEGPAAEGTARLLEGEEREWFVANYAITHMVEANTLTIDNEDEDLADKLLAWSEWQHTRGTLLNIEGYDEVCEEALGA